jgi:hypothetical protein
MNGSDVYTMPQVVGGFVGAVLGVIAAYYTDSRAFGFTIYGAAGGGFGCLVVRAIEGSLSNWRDSKRDK